MTKCALNIIVNFFAFKMTFHEYKGRNQEVRLVKGKENKGEGNVPFYKPARGYVSTL